MNGKRRNRRKTRERGYGPLHQALRRKLVPVVKSGAATCARCGNPLLPWQEWDLGHADHDRGLYNGPEHALKRDCPAGGNRAAGALKGNDPGPGPSRQWAA